MPSNDNHSLSGGCDSASHEPAGAGASKPDENGKNLHARRISDAPFTVAAPSFVIPDTVSGNCRFLAGKVDEAALVFFESEACLNYTDEDLAPDLADLPLGYHVHLPLDLPWALGVDAVAETILGLARKVDYLRPAAYVLHPPDDAAALEPLAKRLHEAGTDPETVLLENIENNDLTGCANAAIRCGFGFCLDLGHYLAFGQKGLTDIPGLWERVRMLHVYGPGPRGEHGPLTRLDDRGRDVLRDWLKRAASLKTVVLEVFREAHLTASLNELDALLDGWGLKR
ncbi:cobamide remodeling phosphodiesterase CbiR [Salidesulfovibrio brasiliensis]|uniref:cobamide remodeling phosphodiesterase CbiR n=1 Tax=Salidesulfovibrio brasiliensis TaxID=221711 RepID=UPI0006D161F6|nr:cobamide remodeling phosphodiesterase CbiR [Salidesulfovibrio brasiliensis]